MPPKQKYTQQSILDAAFEIMRTNGIDAVGSRQVADKLNCSTQPIFSYFKDMEDLKQALISKAKDLYSSYVHKGLTSERPFKGVGLEYINLAKKEPEIFKLLFMSANKNKLDSLLDFDDNKKIILQSLIDFSGLDTENAEKLCTMIWLFTHGIAVMCATDTMTFTEDEISNLLDDAYIGSFMKIKYDNQNQNN